MGLFSTELPATSRYLPPRYYTPSSDFQKFKLAALGYNPNGQRNVFGKVTSWLPFASIEQDALAGSTFRKFGRNTGSYLNFQETRNRDYAKQGTILNAGGAAASAATGDIPAAFNLGSQAFGQGVGIATSKPNFNPPGDYFSYKKGGTVGYYQGGLVGGYEKGGNITAAKAKEMLKNPPGGRPLSKAQRGLFGWIAGGRKDEGGDIGYVPTPFGKGGNVQHTKQPKALSPYQKSQLEMSGDAQSYSGDPNGSDYAASDFDQDMRLQRMQMRLPHHDDGGNVMGNDEKYVAVNKETGQPEFTLNDGENIFSRIATKKIKDMASKKSYQSLGKFVAAELKRQPKNDVKHTGGGDIVPKEYQQLVDDTAKKYGIDTALLASLIKQESNYDPKAKSSAGAVGLGQLMPATAKELGVTDSTDPKQNIDASAKYLKQLLDKYNGDTDKALAAYNFGAGNVDAGKPLPDETRKYVDNIKSYVASFNNAGAAPAPTPPTGVVPPGFPGAEGGNTDINLRNQPNPDNMDQPISSELTPLKGLYPINNPARDVQTTPPAEWIKAMFPNMNIPPLGTINGGGTGTATTPTGARQQDVINPLAPQDNTVPWLPKNMQPPINPIARNEMPPTTNRLGSFTYPKDKSNFLNQIGGAEQLFNLAKFVTGISGATTNLPHWQIPGEWTKHVARLRDLSEQGMTPQEKAFALENQNRSYSNDVTNIRNISGGNSAFALGNSGGAINRFNQGNREMNALNSGLRRQNMADYGNALTQDVGYGRTKFEDLYNEQMMNKQSASQLAQGGAQGLFDQYDYNKNYGAGSTYDNYLKSLTNEANKYSKALAG